MTHWGQSTHLTGEDKILSHTALQVGADSDRGLRICNPRLNGKASPPALQKALKEHTLSTPVPCLTAPGLLFRARLGQMAKGSRVTKDSSKSKGCVCTGLQRKCGTRVQLSPPGGRLTLSVSV